MRRILILTLLLGLPVLSSAHPNQAPLSGFAVDTSSMENFTRQCVHLPSEKKMREEVLAWTQEQKQKADGVFSITLDGFPFRKLTQPEFEVIRTLTIPRGAHDQQKDQYRFTLKAENNSAVMERYCITEACRKNGVEKKFDLSFFQKKNQKICGDSLCAAERIFGPRKGLMILWAYLKYETNLSPLSDLMADPRGLSVSALKAVLAAASLVPAHLHEVALKDTGFFRYLKGTTLPFYQGRKVVANSFGGVFDPIDQLNFSERVYFFIHEMAHRARLTAKPALDESPEWAHAARTKSDVSKYARANLFEDFAETYTLYRVNPTRLKKVSPTRYEYMRDQVFAGFEYLKNPCEGSKENLLNLSGIDRHGITTTGVD